MSYLTVVPAYGRDYKSAKDVKAAWSDGKDFQVRDIGSRDGSYINKADFDKTSYDAVNIRYKRMTLVCVVQRGK